MRQWILDRWREYARICLMLAIFLPPVVFWRETVDVFNLVKISVLLIFGAAALIFWVSYSAESGLWVPKFRLAYAMAAFLLVSALATVFSQNPLLSLTGLYHRYGGLIPFALYAGLMVVMVGMYWDRIDDLRDIAKASALASLLMTLYVLIQEAGLDWIAWQDASGGPPPYPVGTMGNSNFAGGYLGIALPFLVVMAFTAKKDFIKAILFIGVGADVLALWFTQTRGGMIAGGVGIATMAFLYRDKLQRWARLVSGAAAIVAVVIALLVVSDVGAGRSSGPIQRLNVLRTDTLDVRTYYWGTAWRIFLANPVLGTGLETYYANYPKFRLPIDGAKLGLTITDKPHNIFLEYAANAGILGLGTYLSLLSMALWFGYKRLRTLEGDRRLLLTGFVAVLAGYMGQGIFSIDVPPLAVMGWISMGGIAAFSDPGVIEARERLAAKRAEAARRKGGKKAKGRRREPASNLRHGPLRWPIHVAGFGGAALLLTFGLRPLIADVAAKDAQTLQNQKGATDRIVGGFERAVSLHPFEPSYRVQVGAVAEQEAGQTTHDQKAKIESLKRALRHYTQSFELQPGNVFYMMNIGRIYATWGEIDRTKFADADRWWKMAVNHDTTDWEVHNRYALMLNSWANSVQDAGIRARAAEELEKSVEIRPEYAIGWLNLGKIYRSLGRQEDAVEAFRRTLRLEPTNKEALDNLRAMGQSP